MNRTGLARTVALATLAAALGAATPAQALEAAWSGFATLGYARSDSDHRYQRFIDRDGTLKRDSLFAAQLDLQLVPRWSATVQGKIAAAEEDDHGVRPATTWAFVAWRPADDWLLRAGRMRLPLYLYSESLDIGVARDMARMPHEMYSLAPTNDFNGLYVTRNLAWGGTDLALDAYTGSAHTAVRLWRRDGFVPFVEPGAHYLGLRTRITGLVLTAHDGGFTGRLGAFTTATRASSGAPLPLRYPRVELAPGLGYWKVDPALPGPPIETQRSLRNVTLTAGAEWQFGDGWRLAGEAARIRQTDSELGSDSKAGYVALYKRIGTFTPYVSLARQRSSDGLLDWHRRLAHEPLPAGVPGAAEINAAQQVAGDSLYAFDQRSLALGVSHALSATAKLHLEWMRTAVGRTSSHFDALPGSGDADGVRVRTVSLSLSVAF